MSCTEIYGFDKNGDSFLLGEIQNSHRGHTAIWHFLEKKYLSPHDPCGIGHISRINFDNKKQEVWDLVKDDRLTENEKIVMISTFDDVVVRKENFDKLIIAFNSFKGHTSLKEQAKIIESANNCIAVGWNQTSVNSGIWEVYNDEGEAKPYNLNKGQKHWFMFKEGKPCYVLK